MENRFGFKDLILTGLLMILIVSVWLAMKQSDRQWGQLKKIQQAQADQASELKQIRQEIKRAGLVTIRNNRSANINATANANIEALDKASFARLEKARTQPDYAKGDWVVDAFASTVGKLTPLTSSDVYQSVIADYVIQALAQRDPDTLKWTPEIAQSWTVSDDGLTIIFKLRPDVRFSDGHPLTAHDVVFTYNLIMNPKIAAPRARAYYEKIESVKATNDYQVVFKLRETYFKGFDICAGLGIMAKHFYGQFTEEEFNQAPGLLFGSGPYKLSGDPKTWAPGAGKVELLRNDRYWGPEPAFDRLVFREITDANARLVSFRNGEIDRYGPQPEQYLKLKDDKQLRREKTFMEYETATGGYRYVAWNQNRAGKPTFFADKRVRQAMTMLTNRKQMCQQLMVGLATVATGPFNRLGPQANPAVKAWPYDPKQAKRLLKQAGFEDRDGDGIVENKAGKPFAFKLIYPASSQNYKQMAFYLKDAYARAGIVLEPDPLEWTIMIQRIGQRQFDAMTLGWSGSIEGDPYQIFHSKQIADGGDNYVHYQNTKLDSLIDRARVTLDQKKRMKLWHQVHAVLHEDQPYTFLWTTRAVVFQDKRFENVFRTKLGINSREEWYVPTMAQKWGR